MSVYAPSPHPPQLSQPRSSYFSPTNVVNDTSLGQRNTFTLPSRRPLPPIPQSDRHHYDLHQKSSLSPPASWSSSTPSSSSPTPIINHLPLGVPPATNRSFSSFTPRMNRSSTSLLTAVRTPPVLASLLAHLDWVDTFSLLASCKALRDLFRDQDSRDVVVARYVPGYRRALRQRDLGNYHEIPVSIHDLDLLLISQRVPLHRYPVHALKTLTSILPSLDDDSMTEKLIALSQSYSRMVLLLQSIAHSSNEPLSMELEEVKPKRRFMLVPNLRELTFPAPLAYSELASSPESPMDSFINTRPGRTQRTLKTGNLPAKNISHLTIPGGYPGPTLTAKNSRAMMSISDETLRKGRRLSFFGKSASGLPPPPPQEPHTLKQYHKSWRRTMKAPKEPPIDELGFMTDFERPTRRFASANNSSDSSISELGVVNDTSSSASSASSSPHDFALATSRLRAPVLRVFVPCTRLDDGDDNVVQCEQQLEDAGLWEHLSVGDLVCNLGYVPSTGDDSSSEIDDSGASFNLPALRSRSPHVHTRRHSSGLSSTGSAPERKWLIFTGDKLIPYTPPDDVPVHNPLSLPTPFYYAHIMSESACPVFYISQLPVCDDVPQLRLTATTTRLPSPHSPKGHALVKKYVWIARVVRLQGGEEDAAFGGGWFGEWVLEYEGTKEGKRTLLDALAGRNLGLRRWELVREKSGAGKLWLRLLPL